MRHGCSSPRTTCRASRSSSVVPCRSLLASPAKPSSSARKRPPASRSSRTSTCATCTSGRTTSGRSSSPTTSTRTGFRTPCSPKCWTTLAPRSAPISGRQGRSRRSISPHSRPSSASIRTRGKRTPSPGCRKIWTRRKSFCETRSKRCWSGARSWTIWCTSPSRCRYRARRSTKRPRRPTRAATLARGGAVKFTHAGSEFTNPPNVLNGLRFVSSAALRGQAEICARVSNLFFVRFDKFTLIRY